MLLLAYLQKCNFRERKCKRYTSRSDRYLPQLAIRPELKLEKLVTKLALVANIVAEVEIVGHTQSIQKGSAARGSVRQLMIKDWKM